MKGLTHVVFYYKGFLNVLTRCLNNLRVRMAHVCRRIHCNEIYAFSHIADHVATPRLNCKVACFKLDSKNYIYL